MLFVCFIDILLGVVSLFMALSDGGAQIAYFLPISILMFCLFLVSLTGFALNAIRQISVDLVRLGR